MVVEEHFTIGNPNLQNLEDGGSIRGHTAGLSRVSLRLGRSAWQLPALQMEPCTQDT